MKIQGTFVAIFCLLLGLGSAAKLPPTFQRCKVGPELDNKPHECLRAAVEDAIIQLASNGNKDLGVLDLDPLKINEVLIEQGESSPIAIKLKFTDNDLMGLNNIKVKSVSGKTSSPDGFKLVIESFVPRFQLAGPYSVNGKILVLPIQGDGLSNLTMVNIKSKTVIIGESQTKNGKEYLKVKNLNLEMTTTRLFTDLQNLFNGDKALGDNMNKFLNENWQEIYNELRPSVESAFAAILEAYAKRILERVPFKNIFITE